MIRSAGAIGVDTYMALCNAHYYATRDPLGAGGDFTTAPEVSQMFGEIVGAVLADCWARSGSPADAVYAELGPGRGTLAHDALRVVRRAGFGGAVHLVETSSALRKRQAERLGSVHFEERIEALPRQPLLLVANEFLDALPVRQFVHTPDGPRERKVALAGDEPAFTEAGEIHEVSPVRDEAVHAVARHLARFGGIALVIDYGHARTAPGDTLQAVHAHNFADPLASPGEQDLSAHVDFERLQHVARDAGALVTELVKQGEWLRRLGIDARTEALSRAHPTRAQQFQTARDRLCETGQMGSLFKVVALHAPAWPCPAGFA